MFVSPYYSWKKTVRSVEGPQDTLKHLTEENYHLVHDHAERKPSRKPSKALVQYLNILSL